MRRHILLAALVLIPSAGATLPTAVLPTAAVSGLLYPITWSPNGGAGYTAKVLKEPGPPFPTGALAGPKDNATVTLKAAVCNQVVTVSIKPGGHIRFQRAIGTGVIATADNQFDWLSVLPAALADTADGHGIDNDRIYAGFYDVITFPLGGHFTLDYASSECAATAPTGYVYTTPAYIPAATVVKITVT